MRFTLSASLAVLPVLAAALPHENHISIPITKRSSLKNADGTVNVQSLRRHIASAESKIRRGNAAYERNSGRSMSVMPPVTSRKRGDGGDVASDPLTDDDAQLWYGSISVGSPPVKYTVDFDTGSSDLFLPAENCKENCDGHTAYDPSKSKSSKALSKSFSLSYGDGSTVSGKQYSDTVSIAGLTAEKQVLGAASQYSEGFSSQQFPADGLLGMGYQAISEYNAPPLFQSLVEQKKVTEPVFAFKLAKEGSELTLGGLNSKLYQGEFSYTKVTKQGYWMVNMDSAAVGGETVLKSVSAIIDTGTTLLIGDQKDVAKIYKGVKGAKDASETLGSGIWTVPCDSIPEISLTFSGKSYTLSKESMSLGPAEKDSKDCVSGLGYANLDGIGWIVGDVFLQNVYTAFDLGKNQVGFAALA